MIKIEANRRKLSPSDTFAVAELYAAGEPTPAIAKTFGVSVDRVRYIARRHGVEIRRRGRPSR